MPGCAPRFGHLEPKSGNPDRLAVGQPTREIGASLVELGDLHRGDFSGRHELRVSVSPLMSPSDVVECLQVLADAYMKAAEALLFSPGDFEADTGNGNVVEVYPLDKEEGGESG